MAQDTEIIQKSRITEIHVRMDCNGCVQKIKKALHAVDGICEQYIDFPQQKITIIGWADPEKIVKAIKRTRKSAVICCQTEPLDPPEESSKGDGGDLESKKPQPSEESAAAEPPPPPVEASNVPPPPPSENTKPEANSPRHSDGHETSKYSRPKDVEEIHVIYHHPPDYGYRYPPPTRSPDYRYRYDFDDKIGRGYTREMYSYQSSPGYIPSRYHTTVEPDASIPEPLGKRYVQWDSYSNRTGIVHEPPVNKRYGEEGQSYPSNARSTPHEPPTNPRDGRQTRYPINTRSTPPEPLTDPRDGGQMHSYLSNARSTPPQPPINHRDGGKLHSYPSNARSTTPEPLSTPRYEGHLHSYSNNLRSTTPEPSSDPRDGRNWHSYSSNPRSTTPEPSSDPRDGRKWRSYHMDHGPEPEPELEPQSYFRPRVRTQQHYSGGPPPRAETQLPTKLTHNYNTYKPSPYVTGYEYVTPPPPYYTNYTGHERYTEDYHYENTGNGNVTSIFSDENPNSCRII